jgi:hypothetical protein
MNSKEFISQTSSKEFPMNAKFVLIVLVIALLAASLSACGGGGVDVIQDTGADAVHKVLFDTSKAIPRVSRT